MFKSVLVLLLSIALSSCGQIKSFSVKTEPVNSGLVYFSKNNGLDWENASAGLPDSLSIGLGGIAVSESLLGIATKELGVFVFDEKINEWYKLPASHQMIKDNVGALFFYKNGIFVGTQFGGVYYSDDMGETWNLKNLGITDNTIRRFEEINEVLYVTTNNGLYSYNNTEQKWNLVYRKAGLQVNGVTEFKDDLYLATNQGVYKSDKSTKEWSLILPNHSVHNIASYENTIYAMTYNALLISSLDGITWQSCQAGLPPNLYTFNVVRKGDKLFAGQWDGVYSKVNPVDSWSSSSKGLPVKFAATNLKIYKDMMVVSTAKSDRK